MAAPQPEPRVRPRVRIEELVDREKHPPRRRIKTRTPVEVDLHWTTLVALVALGIFWVTLPVGVLVTLGIGPALVAWAVSSLVVAWLMGSE